MANKKAKENASKRKKPENKAPTGRPLIPYDKTIGDQICKAIATSTDGIQRMCKKYPHFPKRDTINEWRWENKDFSAQYRDAKRAQAELMAEDIIQISDDGTNDTYVDAKGNVVTDQDVIQRSKLRVDARKWVAARLLPKIYGDSWKEEKNPVDDVMTKINELMETKRDSNKREY